VLPDALCVGLIGEVGTDLELEALNNFNEFFRADGSNFCSLLIIESA